MYILCNYSESCMWDYILRKIPTNTRGWFQWHTLICSLVSSSRLRPASITRISQFSRPRNFCDFGPNTLFFSENERISHGLLYAWSVVFVLQISSNHVCRAFGDYTQTQQKRKHVRIAHFSCHNNYCVLASNFFFLFQVTKDRVKGFLVPLVRFTVIHIQQPY